MVDASLDIKQLKMFCLAARLQSIKLAANRLSVTSSAVSQAIANLEKSLDSKLFSRNVRPLQLTVKGRTLLWEAEKLIKQEELLRAKLTEPSASLVTLRLGISEAVSSSIAPWLLDHLYKTVNNLTVYSHLSNELLKKLSRNQLDVALCSGFQPEGDNWYRKEVWREEFLIVSSRSLGKFDAKLLKTLAGQIPFICYNSDYQDQYRAERLLSAMNIDPVHRIAVSSSYELMGLISLRDGFAIVPPTNIWCGREFFKSVYVSRLPINLRTYRGMWAVGSALDRSEATELVYWEARSRMQHFMSEFLAGSCPGLEQYIQFE